MPISLSAAQLSKNGFLVPVPALLSKIVGSPLGAMIEDVTPDSRANDIGRRKINITLPMAVCGDLVDCFDPCTYEGTFDEMQRPQEKEFETTCVGVRPKQFSTKDFTDLLGCDFQSNAWQGYFMSLQKNLASKINKRMMEELDSVVGVHADGTTGTKEVSLVGISNGAIQPVGVAMVKHEFAQVGWQTSEGELIVVGDMAALTANITLPLQTGNNYAGQAVAALNSQFDFTYDSNAASISGSANNYYVFHREAFRILFFSRSKELNRQLNGNLVQAKDFTKIKEVFTARAADGVQSANRIETFTLIPVHDAMGKVQGYFPVDIVGIYDSKCDKWNVFMSVNFVVLTDLQVSCGDNRFNGILKFEHCAFSVPACDNPEEPEPIDPPDPLCMPSLTAKYPIEVNTIEIYNGGSGHTVITLFTPITVANTAGLEALLPHVAAYGGTWSGTNLCFASPATQVGFNGGTAYTLA